MNDAELVMRRTHSECLSLSSQIYSPLPVKRTPRISSNLAQEIFDFSSPIEEIKIKPRANTTVNIITIRPVASKPDSDSSNEFYSESNCSSFMKECESPASLSKNPFYQEHIFEEIALELPSRSSNPIIRDDCFKRNNKKHFGLSSNTAAPCALRNF